MSFSIGAVLFDVFGTLVRYEPELTMLDYPETHEVAASVGFAAGHEVFVQRWDEVSRRLEAAAEASLLEYSMVDVAAAFCGGNGILAGESTLLALADSFISEWQRHVVAVPGVASMIETLHGTLRLGVVSNTHDPHMVGRLLTAAGIADAFDVVVLSVDCGRRKPHPSIYASALSGLGTAASRSVFVGDSYEADYAAPTRLGLTSFLIDAERRHVIAPGRRLDSVIDLPAAIACGS